MESHTTIHLAVSRRLPPLAEESGKGRAPRRGHSFEGPHRPSTENSGSLSQAWNFVVPRIRQSRRGPHPKKTNMSPSGIAEEATKEWLEYSQFPNFRHICRTVAMNLSEDTATAPLVEDTDDWLPRTEFPCRALFYDARSTCSNHDPCKFKKWPWEKFADKTPFSFRMESIENFHQRRGHSESVTSIQLVQRGVTRD